MKKTKMLLLFILGGMFIFFPYAYSSVTQTASENSGPDSAKTVPEPPMAPTAQATAQTFAESTTASTFAATEQPASVQTAAVAEEKVNKIEIDNSASNEEDGIVILNPGETSTEELEKHILTKNKTTPVDGEDAGKTEENVTFEGPDSQDGETGGIILMEAETGNKIEKVGYVMVERAGFISDNFVEDGFIYDVDGRETIVQGMQAYIKITVGKSIKKGMQFLIYTDREKVEDIVTGENKGCLIDVRAVGKIIEKADEGIWKVGIIKSYGAVEQNFKIKMRKDFKDYYNKVTTKIKKKTGVIEAFIIKVQNNNINIKKKDVLYLNKGVKAGLMPGETMTVYRSIPNRDTGKNDIYHKTGKLLVINSMKDSSVAIVTEQTGIINPGDLAKTSK